MSHDHPESFTRHLVCAIPVILGVSAVVLFLHQGIWFHSFENATLDALLLLREPRKVSDVVIVEIQDKDYHEMFNGTSPLSPQKLQELLRDIAAGQPRVIGVDLDTSSPAFKFFHVPEGWPPVVWARDAIPAEEEGAEEEVFRPQPVLGGQLPEPPRTGIALLPQDADGIMRRYRRVFRTSGSPLDSFPRQVALADPKGDAKKLSGEREHGDRVLNFAGDRRMFDRVGATAVREGAKGGQVWAKNGPLVDKIVLLGGSYRASRDEYVTPLGPMWGVDLMALAVQAEREDGGIRAADHVLMVGLEVLAGVLLVFIHYLFEKCRFSLRWALGLSLVAIPVLALLASFLAFSTFAYWLNAVPLLAAVLIHQLYDHARHYREMYRKVSGEETETGAAHSRSSARSTTSRKAPRFQRRRGMRPTSR